MTNAREFTNRLVDLLRREQGAMADFLVALAEFDRKGLWLELGHSSLFYFLRRELGLSAGAAQYRKTAAELVRKFPAVESALRDGRLCLSSVAEVAKVLTPENADEILPRFFGLSSRDAAMVVASIRPITVAPTRDVVTRVCAASVGTAGVDARTSAADQGTGPVTAGPGETVMAFRAPEIDRPNTSVNTAPGAMAHADAHRKLAATATTLSTTVKPFSVEPVDGERARIHVTVSRRLLEKLDAARAALSHAKPGATAGEILEAGLDLLLARDAKRKALVAKPRKMAEHARDTLAPEAASSATSSGDSRTVPAAVKRAVRRRAGKCCEWPLDGGGVCASTLRLELDHIVPVALGGASTIGNLRVLCRVHNQLAARGVFGDEWMDRYARQRVRTLALPGPASFARE